MANPNQNGQWGFIQPISFIASPTITPQQDANNNVYFTLNDGPATRVYSGQSSPIIAASGVPTGSLYFDSANIVWYLAEVVSGSNTWVQLPSSAVPGPAGPQGPSGLNGILDATVGYGVRATPHGIYPNTTASIASTSQSATLAAASTFQNGDGIVIYGAGATNSLSTPGAPTVAPAQANTATNTGRVATLTNGGTSYQYQIVARTKNGGLTAASTAGATTTGAASLGVQSATIVTGGCSRSNQTVTVTTSAAHGIMAGAVVCINMSTTDSNQKTTDYGFQGFFIVATVPTNTTFTFKSGMDTRGGAPTASFGGGTVTYYVCNHVTWTAVTGAYQYYIYGRTNGNMTLLGATKSSELFWDDYGSTYSAAPTLPDFVPSTPPVSAVNEYLATTIVSGAGTTNIVLATAAGNTVSSATAKFCNGPTLLAAATAARAAGSILYLPASGLNYYVINSHTILPSLTSLWQNGSIYLNETLELSSAILWTGVLGGSASAPQFAYTAGRVVSVNTAYPGVMFTNQDYLQALTFLVPNQGCGLWMDAYEGNVKNCNFSLGSGGQDYSGMVVVGMAMAEIIFDTCLFSVSGPENLAGASLTPTVFGRQDVSGESPSGAITFTNCFWNSRGVCIENESGLMIFEHPYAQQLVTPLMMFSESSANAATGWFRIHNFVNDTSSVATIANWITNVCFGELLNNEGTSGVYPIVTGLPFTSLRVINSVGTVGQTTNVNYELLNDTLGVPVYGIGTSSEIQMSKPFHFPAQHTLYWDLQSPQGVSATVQSGGSITAGTGVVQVVALGLDGGYSAPSTVEYTTTTGNQTLLVQWTESIWPNYAVKYYIYLNSQYVGVVNHGTTSFTVSSNGSGVTPVGCGSGSTTVMATQILAPQLLLQPILFANLGTPTYNGTFMYCADCTKTTPCAGSGSGALAKYINGAWDCD